MPNDRIIIVNFTDTSSTALQLLVNGYSVVTITPKTVDELITALGGERASKTTVVSNKFSRRKRLQGYMNHLELQLSHKYFRLIHQKVAHGDRSKVLWRLINECMEAGLTDLQVYEVLRDSVWNKIDVDLMDDIQRARYKHRDWVCAG